MRRTLAIVAVAALSVPATMFAQGNSDEHRPELIYPSVHDTSPAPLRDMFSFMDSATPARGGRDFEPGRPESIGNTNKPFEDPLAARGTGGVGAFAVPIAAGTSGTPVDPTYRVAPPDTTGDLGPNHYVQWVNLRYAIYDVVRSSGTITGFNLKAGFPKNGSAIFAGMNSRCATDNDGDPIVQYDQTNDRWVLTQFAVSSSPYLQCVAVSTSPDPSGTYNRYEYSFGTDFNDFPKMGIWGDKYVITYNMFRRGRTFAGSKVCSMNGTAMRAGTSAPMTCAQTSNSYGSLLPADVDGSVQPADLTTIPLLSLSSSAVYSWRFNTSTGVLTGPSTISGVTTFSRACSGGTCIPQPGTSQKLDSLADRLNYRLAYRNFTSYETMVVAHSVTSGTGTAVRWYEFRNATGQTLSSAAPVVYQQGTYGNDNNFRWMGSAAMDKTGGIAIGYNISNASSIVPSIRYAVRGPADTLGTMGAEQAILTGGGVQTGNQLSRWGDYSTVSVDPTDGCQMVFTTEYIPSNGAFNWATYIHAFKISSCQ